MSPPVEVALATELPVEPVTASPDVELSAAPEPPPVAIPLLLPDEADRDVTCRGAFDELTETMERLTDTSPLFPDEGWAIAAPPSPDPAVDDGVFAASPELPVVPAVATAELDDAPEAAVPVAVGVAMASPELPPVLDPPTLTVDDIVEVAADVAAADEPLPAVLPEMAVPVLTGLAVANPVLPPTELDEAIELPVAPDSALPWALLVAAPELPPLATELAFPELPEMAITRIEPGPNEVFDELMTMITVTAPVLPDVALAAALPPFPLVAAEETLLLAFPELPLLPDCAEELLDELPEVEVPLDDELAVAPPEEPPPPPPPPDVAVAVALGLELAEPLLPLLELEVAEELPVAPDVADPCAPLVALPELPPVAVAVALPLLPEVAMTMMAPLAIVSLDPLTTMYTVMGPTLPEVGVAAAVPPLPVFADELLLLTAVPEVPVLPA